MRKISLYDISIFVSYYRVLFDVYILIYLFIIMICRSIIQHFFLETKLKQTHLQHKQKFPNLEPKSHKNSHLGILLSRVCLVCNACTIYGLMVFLVQCYLWYYFHSAISLALCVHDLCLYVF
jgi:hypothetical protein